MSSEDSESQKIHSAAQTLTIDSSSMGRWKILAFGQGLSCLLAAMLASQSTLFLKCDWGSPAFSCVCAYLLLSLHMIPLYLRGRSIRQQQQQRVAGGGTMPTHWFLNRIPIQTSPLTYFGMALASFYGNFFCLTALRLTTVSSTSIFDAMAVPTTMVLSHFFLGRRYVRLHLFGATLCLVGLLLNTGVDVVSNHLYRAAVSEEKNDPTSNATDELKDDGAEEYPHKVVGDLLACLGGILFGTNDVLAEFAVRRPGAGSTEYLAMIGFFGWFIALAQSVLSERSKIVALFQGATNCGGNVMAGLLVLYVIGQFSRKAGLAKFLTLSDAALLSLSLLTSDLYVTIFSIVYQNIFPRSLFWVAMTLVLTGIVLYELGRSPIMDTKQKVKDADGEGISKDP